MTFTGRWLHEASADDAVAALRQSFASAAPFPHVVIEGIVGPSHSPREAGGAAELAADFPKPDWDGWHHYGDRYQQGKMICSDIALIPASLGQLIDELTRPAFLEFLEQLTGIEKLLVDPYLEGGGLHCSGPGGVLVPHTDFHLYPKLGLYRRINVLVYLNEEWEADWGGGLELYAGDAEGKAPDRVVVPTWGTCVIFRTDDRSRHGFTKPVASPHYRRSVALYYYTAYESDQFSGDGNTYWSRVPLTGLRNRVRQAAYDVVLLAARFLAFVAHRIDPNLTKGTPKD